MPDKEASTMALRSEFPKGINSVWIYLRKSREDRDAEERARREGREDIETLSRHRRTLLTLARTHQHNVTRVLEEVVSGEYISERPEMQRLLGAVENGLVQAVWVMDLDRLGRGDMADQGTILRAFKDTATLILTPDQVYDLTDERDEEWTEFKTFFARRELKMITKRMQRGRIASVQEGKYIGTRPPFGYDVNGDLVLVPNRDADTVRLIFDLYVNKHLGANRIADYLNQMGIKSPKGNLWYGDIVLPIIRNEVYAGYIVWRKIRQDMRKHTYHKRDASEQVRAKGQHQPLIDESTFQQSVQIRMRRSNSSTPKPHKISSPLSGLVTCGKCGKRMVRRPYVKQPPHLICPYSGCDNKSTRLSIVEDKILTFLEDWLTDYELSMDAIASALTPTRSEAHAYHAKIIKALDEEIRQINAQRDGLHDLLEQGIYDANTYLARRHKLNFKLAELQERRTRLKSERAQNEQVRVTPLDVSSCVKGIVDVYRTSDSPEAKNNLLKAVLEKVVYVKEKHQQGDNFEITLYPLV
jgi:site-specific DNA recombinase